MSGTVGGGFNKLYRKGKTMPPNEPKAKGDPCGGYPVFVIKRRPKPAGFDRSRMCPDVFEEPKGGEK